jgi:poly(3-hydroxybutyrate) depolymerase
MFQKRSILNYRILIVLVLLVLMASVRGFAGQRDELPKGEIVENVTSKADPQQTYALYLPSRYSSDKKWPMLYAFDPGARGKLPVSLFKDAAEKFGYIVVGSNNSKNGIQVAGVIQTIWADTHARFAIDDTRVYTTGFSGGARVAFATALAYQGAVAGVIACSAGFPGNAPPAPGLAFAVFATTGTEDFNFPEMQQLKRKLDSVGARNHLEVFAGGHDWAPADLCTQAIAWMELQAMRRGIRAKDEGLIDQLLQERTAAARAYETAGKNYEAYLEFQTLAVDFKDLRDAKELEANAARLAVIKETKAAIKSERNEEDRQRDLETKLQTLLGQLQNPGTYSDAFAELKSVVSDLTRKSEDTKDLSQQRVARRTLQAVFAQVYEAANGLALVKDHAGVAEKLELAALLKPKNPRLFYELAIAYTRAGNKSKAINALGRAIENGFTDLAKIEQNSDFDPLRNEAGYKKLVTGFKKTM